MNTKFNKIQKENSNLSSLICFIKTLYTKKYTKGEIRKWFNILVDKNDYEGTSKKELLDFILNVKCL